VSDLNGEGGAIPAVKPVIVIDPGHGGKDPGTTGAGDVHEKTITLEMGKELARELRATGRYTVRLTRTSDAFVSLPQRVAIADKDRADLFISLHCNWIKDRAIHGLAIYTLSGKASDRETAMLARHENSVDYVNGVDLHERNPDVAKILLSLAQREATNRAVIFASDVIQALGPKYLLQPDPHRSADFRVLIDPDVPSVLIEMAYLSNPQDEHDLESPIWRAQLGGRLVAAINQYFAAVHD
jgi:N-acetylmuramoyl-L-alanine amidase